MGLQRQRLYVIQNVFRLLHAADACLRAFQYATQGRHLFPIGTSKVYHRLQAIDSRIADALGPKLGDYALASDLV